MNEISTKSCLFCERQLEPAASFDWEYMRPYYGGEIQFIFCFGSTKFDNNIGNTVFSALICDDCAEKYVSKMEEIS